MVAGMHNLAGGVLLLAVYFFSPPTLYFLFASHRIMHETVSVPPFTHMDVKAGNKDLCKFVLTVHRALSSCRKLPGISSLTDYWTSTCQQQITTSDG